MFFNSTILVGTTTDLSSTHFVTWRTCSSTRLTSDASGWDLSVNSDQFWSAWRYRVDLASSEDHKLYLRVNGYFQCSYVVYDGESLWEVVRHGVTASGKSWTAACNCRDRSDGLKASQLVALIGGCQGIGKTVLARDQGSWVLCKIDFSTVFTVPSGPKMHI